MKWRPLFCTRNMKGGTNEKIRVVGSGANQKEHQKKKLNENKAQRKKESGSKEPDGGRCLGRFPRVAFFFHVISVKRDRFSFSSSSYLFFDGINFFFTTRLRQSYRSAPTLGLVVCVCKPLASGAPSTNNCRSAAKRHGKQHPKRRNETTPSTPPPPTTR